MDNQDIRSQAKSKRSMRDIAPLEKVMPQVHPATEYQNIPIILVAFEERMGDDKFAKDGQRRKYYLLECLTPDSDETIWISMGGVYAVKQIEMLNAVEDLPMEITLKKHVDGKSWYID